MIRTIGYGYWGPNIVRNLRSLEGCQVAAVCGQSPAALADEKIKIYDKGVQMSSWQGLNDVAA